MSQLAQSRDLMMSASQRATDAGGVAVSCGA